MPISVQDKLGDLFKAHNGVLNYAQFIEFALYDSDFGYYIKKQKRVGKDLEADFYTSQSMGSPVLKDLIVGSIANVLGELGEYTFYEAGVEPHGGLFEEGQKHPFKAIQTIRVGDPIDIQGKAIVYSNELFDAQPFHRYVFLERHWRERGVDSDLKEVLLPGVVDWLPEGEFEPGYQLDLSLAADSLMQRLCEGDWTGMMLAFDYGKSWQGLLNDCPQGTARTYFKHTQGADLLSNIGEQDITAHVCWDRLEEVLNGNGFHAMGLERQEAFFVKNAASELERLMNSGDPKVMGALKELIYAGDMGSKFQVLYGLR